MNSSDMSVPLTLHRKDGIFQSVLLVLGCVPKAELKIVQVSKVCTYEDDLTRQVVTLSVMGNSFPISLPLFLYFVNQSNGAVTPSCAPILTHNIAKLETLLLSVFKSDESEIELLINTTRGQTRRSMYISDDKVCLG